MKLSSIIHSRTGLALVCTAAALSGLAAVRAHADSWDKKTVLTVGTTIQVRDTVLPPGKYVLKLYDSPSQRHVVQIFNEDQSRIIDTVMAIPAQRMQPTGDTSFTFWETPAGHARALRAWYYPGDTIGNEFPYPKNPKLLAMASTAEVSTQPMPEPVRAPEPAATEPAETAQPAEPTEVKPVEETPAVDDQAQSKPADPPAQTPAADTPAVPPSTQSSELPKTGSPYPLIGLGGALLLAVGGLLRLTRTA